MSDLPDNDDSNTPGVDVRAAHEIPKLTPEEQLRLQQLLQVRFWQNSRRESNLAAAPGEGSPSADPQLPESWEFLRGITLHEWQRECVDRWFNAGRRGVIKVVTGAGKTILALAIAERLRNQEQPQLRIAIIVPTVVLLTQWVDEFHERSNLPSGSIGSVGGGRSDTFNEQVRVMICVINSASKKLPAEVSRAGIGEQLLLIVDECHRAGASEMRHVLETPHAFSLGLSATPEREDDESGDRDGEPEAASVPRSVPFEETILGRSLGPVIYELTYAQAIERGILPPFRVVHYGLSLNHRELASYEKISREIKDLRSELETPNRRGLALIRWCRSKVAAGNPKAQSLVARTSERKRLLFRVSDRSVAVDTILREHFTADPEAKAILFHESIDEVMMLFSMLRCAGLPVVAEHSELPDTMRAESLRLFRLGLARIIVSARSLIEGFNVPSADIGIIVAASSSVRQRVQTLGRLLRKSQRSDGKDKEATLYVLYCAHTVDEFVYEKADWEDLIGAGRNEYFAWTDVRNAMPEPQPGPPRRPLLGESTIDLKSLSVGGVYPGDPEEGQLYTEDTQGTLRDVDGHLLKTQPDLMALLRAYGHKGGRFRVTPERHFVVKLEKAPGGWRAVYLGQLGAMPEIAEDHGDVVLGGFAPGDRYPLGKAKGRTFSVLQRDRRLIANKTPEGIRFVVPAEKVSDPRKASALRELQQQLVKAQVRGHRISKITVTNDGHVLYIFNSEAYFIGLAPEGANGFQWEELPAKPARGEHR